MSGTSHVVQSLVVNVSIAAAKGVAAAVTGSGAMLAEAIHSSADCGNQILLLVGARQARLPPTPRHPLGLGRSAYFWAFLVSLLLFSVGGLFSIVEGVHKLAAPTPVERPLVGLAILFFSLVLEGGATLSNVREMNRRRGATGFAAYLRDTKDVDLVLVFGENSAAVLGLVVAIAALGLAWLTGDGRWDGAGSTLVGVVLVGVAAFLANETHSLLVGEAADPEIERKVREVAVENPDVVQVFSMITLQQGPGEVLLAVKVRVAPHLVGDEVAEAINRFETEVHARCPEVRWSFVEPDVRD